MTLVQMLKNLPAKGSISLFNLHNDTLLCEYLDDEIIINHYYDFTTDDWSFLSAYNI